jgi:hypothetical protein
MTLVVEQSTPLTVMKVFLKDSQKYYRCVRPDNKDIIVARDRWVFSNILSSGQIYQGYTYKDTSGTQYYTWTLEAK